MEGPVLPRLRTGSFSSVVEHLRQLRVGAHVELVRPRAGGPPSASSRTRRPPWREMPPRARSRSSFTPCALHLRQQRHPHAATAQGTRRREPGPTSPPRGAGCRRLGESAADSTRECSWPRSEAPGPRDRARRQPATVRRRGQRVPPCYRVRHEGGHENGFRARGRARRPNIRDRPDHRQSSPAPAGLRSQDVGLGANPPTPSPRIARRGARDGKGCASSLLPTTKHHPQVAPRFAPAGTSAAQRPSSVGDSRCGVLSQAQKMVP